MKRSYSNAEIKRILVGIPKGHKHLRVLIETADGGEFLFQEATLANIARAYTAIKTHPQKVAVELILTRLDERKASYAEFQLLETDRDEDSIIEELMDF